MNFGENNYRTSQQKWDKVNLLKYPQIRIWETEQCTACSLRRRRYCDWLLHARLRDGPLSLVPGPTTNRLTVFTNCIQVTRTLHCTILSLHIKGGRSDSIYRVYRIHRMVYYSKISVSTGLELFLDDFPTNKQNSEWYLESWTHHPLP